MEAVRCPFGDCQTVWTAEVWDTLPCPACNRLCRTRPVRLEASLEARRRQCEAQRVQQGVLSLVLEDIRSLWNVGSMLRSADCFGVAHVFLCGITPTPPHPEIERTALGAAVSWSYCTHVFAAFESLQGARLVALECVPEAVRLRDVAPGRIALVVGNEPGGVSPEVLAACHDVARIPMRGTKESLNVAVACGIGLYHLQEACLRQ